jgi:uncharacterized protein YndB with AHSA1/START domain
MTASTQPKLAPVVKRIVVKCRPEDAFRYFTADFDKWWPGHTHSVIAMSTEGARRPQTCTMDPRPRGLIVEHGADGERYVWGTIMVWDPPRKVEFTWHPGSDERLAQTVEVAFTAVPGGTEVVLTHGGWDRLAEKAAAARARYDNGWESVFGRAFREYVEQRQP